MVLGNRMSWVETVCGELCCCVSWRITFALERATCARCVAILAARGERRGQLSLFGGAA
jgi:hypothetical protein